MLFLTLPADIGIGETVGCQINGQPARVTWVDKDHLVVEPDDIRQILATDLSPHGELLSFMSADEGGAGVLITPGPDGTITTAGRLPDLDEPPTASARENLKALAEITELLHSIATNPHTRDARVNPQMQRVTRALISIGNMGKSDSTLLWAYSDAADAIEQILREDFDSDRVT